MRSRRSRKNAGGGRAGDALGCLLVVKDVTDATGVSYDSRLAPTSGLALLVAYNVIRRVIVPAVRRAQQQADPPSSGGADD